MQLEQALALSEGILQNIELNELSLTNIVLKASRLARLLNDFEYQKIFQYEASGYPTTPDGISPEIFSICKKANRVYLKKKDGETSEYANRKSIEQYEHELSSAQDSLKMSADANVSITSSNPSQYVHAPSGNKGERKGLRNEISDVTEIISSRKSFIYDYVLEKNYELKFSKVNNDIFNRTQTNVDAIMGELLPDTIKKFTSAYNNLTSENDEDWSNAVHSCRRILQDLSDKIYPARGDKVLENGKKVKLGTENYINRLIAYIEEHSESKRFEELVGSNLSYIGQRLDSIFHASQKGSHKVISSQDEADRYVIYTYLLVGDILKLNIEVKNQIDKSV